MMIAIVLLIHLLSHVNCQQMQPWPSYSNPLQVSVIQKQNHGLDSGPCFQSLPIFQGRQEYFPTPQSAKTNPSSMSSSFPSLNSPYTSVEPSSQLKRGTSLQMPITSNLSNKISEILSTIPKTTPTISKPIQSFEPLPYTILPTNQFPSPQYSQPQAQISPLPQSSTQFSSLPPTPSFTAPAASQIPAPAMPSFKSPRSIIPSPLDEIMTQNDDPFWNMFDLPEPKLGSVGCLALTMTPYGTISETPLPDPSIPLPRSPFLPVSSPVSALAPPLSPNLPPASISSSSNHFLRKVPVPPPFI